MLDVFSLIFVADTKKIIFRYDFVAPLREFFRDILKEDLVRN